MTTSDPDAVGDPSAGILDVGTDSGSVELGAEPVVAKMEYGAGASEYGDLAKALVDGQDARKSSIEQRGMSVITTSGTLVTLLFGLVAVVTKAQDIKLPRSSHGPLGAAMVLFVVSAALALGTNVPVRYKNMEADELLELLRKHAGDASEVAKVRVASTRIRIYGQASKVNEWKARVLILAMLSEVAAVALVAYAVARILVTAK